MDNNNKLYNVLCYFCPLWLVGLLAAPNEPEVRFHVNQGIVLSIGWAAVIIINIIPLLGQVICFIGSIFFLVLAIMGIINASKGVQKELPLIGKIKIIK